MTPAERQKALRERRKVKGQCISCQNKARSGKTVCQSCQQKRTKSTSKYRQNHKVKFNSTVLNRYNNKRKSKICIRCSNTAEPNRTLCLICNSYVKTVQKRHYENYKLQRKCTNCGKSNTISTLCDLCSSTRKTYTQKPVVQQHNREYREVNWRRTLLSTLKARAKKRSVYVDPDLSWEDIPDPAGEKCPVFDQAYVMGSGNKHAYSATVDRINPLLGYVRGNIQLLSSLANDIKSDADIKLIERIGEAVIKKELKILTGKNRMFMDEKTKSYRQKMISQKKSSNKHKRKLKFDIEWFHIFLPRNCPCTGFPIDYGNLSNDWKRRPTIDRVNNELGYVPWNVWVISAQANAVKSSATGHQILKVANWLKHHIS